MLFADRQDALELIRLHDATGGITRRIQNQQPRFPRDGFLDRRSPDAESVSRPRLHEHWCSARVLHDVGEADPVGRGDDDLVPLLHKDAHDVEDGMLAADAYDALFRFVGRAKLALVPRADGLAQRHDAARRRIFRFVLLDCLDRRLLDVVRRRKVRLAGAEVGDVNTARLQLVGFGDDRRRRRNLDAVNAVRELHAGSLGEVYSFIADSSQSRKDRTNPASARFERRPLPQQRTGK